MIRSRLVFFKPQSSREYVAKECDAQHRTAHQGAIGPTSCNVYRLRLPHEVYDVVEKMVL